MFLQNIILLAPSLFGWLAIADAAHPWLTEIGHCELLSTVALVFAARHEMPGAILTFSTLWYGVWELWCVGTMEYGVWYGYYGVWVLWSMVCGVGTIVCGYYGTHRGFVPLLQLRHLLSQKYVVFFVHFKPLQQKTL